MNNKAFTLIEILVAVLIIGILAAIAVPQYQKAVVKSRAAHLQSVLSNIVKASNEYYLQTGQYPTSFEQLDIDFNLPTGEAPCSANFVPNAIKNGDGFEITLNTGGKAKRYRIGAFFTEGRYKCTGFAHVLKDNPTTPSKYDGKTFCVESYYRRFCGTNCDNGDFCKKIMGMEDLAGYTSTVYFYE